MNFGYQVVDESVGQIDATVNQVTADGAAFQLDGKMMALLNKSIIVN